MLTLLAVLSRLILTFAVNGNICTDAEDREGNRESVYLRSVNGYMPFFCGELDSVGVTSPKLCLRLCNFRG